MSAAEHNIDNKLVTEKFEAYWFEPSVFYIRLYEDSEQDIEDVIQNIDFQKAQKVGLEHTRIVQAEKYASISKAGRDYLQKHGITVKAEAFIMPSLSQKILFNLYVKLRSNKNPIKGFDSLENALAWLKEFK